ncbi:MAG: hypothetical protein PHN49_10765 [Candidatus Omnitrophica bacterium]|nr:hypothetical protein [Candidatus Omnitrophota bacterium]MDD5672110.1 hypothetical protein [Candidatus Omnitrophota bacterium]
MNFYRIRVSKQQDPADMSGVVQELIGTLCPGLQIYPLNLTVPGKPYYYFFQESCGRCIWVRIFLGPLTQKALESLLHDEMPRVKELMAKSMPSAFSLKAFVFFKSIEKGVEQVFPLWSKDWLWVEYDYHETPAAAGSRMAKRSLEGTSRPGGEKASSDEANLLQPIQPQNRFLEQVRLSHGELAELFEIYVALQS